MAERPENSSSVQHGSSTTAQHESSTVAQHGPSIAWKFDDDDGDRGDAYLDAPIPYRLSHEAGVDLAVLDAIDPNGSVP